MITSTNAVKRPTHHRGKKSKLDFLRRTVQGDNLTHLGSFIKDTCKLVMDKKQIKRRLEAKSRLQTVGEWKIEVVQREPEGRLG